MTWQNGELKNPFSGKPLEKDSAHSLTDGDERFPVIAQIPFLRAKRDELRRETLRALDLRDERAALMLLLQDQDDWAKTPPPSEDDLQPLFNNEDLTLREAMQCLKYGAVADYFAYRWSDPTYLSGLALLEWHLPSDAKQVFELCCGIGHYLREFALRGIEASGADVVFSKLWLARKFVAPESKLVCLDANKSFPFAENVFDAAFCHDAFYFLPEKQFVAEELKRVVTPNGAIIIGHAHNSEADNFSSGAAVSVNEYKQFFDDSILYDDKELTGSIIEDRHPQTRAAAELQNAEAIAIVTNMANATRKATTFALPPASQSLQINPLLREPNFQVSPMPKFPSARYRDEYAALSDYLVLGNEKISFSDQETAFYGRWESDERLINLVRRRVFVDLPEEW